MTIKPDLDQPIPETLGRVHFVGVGGAGMSAIARMCLDRGLSVSGSDRTANANTDMLASRGARIAIGHDAVHVEGVDTVVVTSALWPDNPELLEARRRGLPVLHRSQALHWLIGDGRVVAVAGAHGKTTSTGMIVTALLDAGRSPGFVNGGVIAELGTASALGTDAEFVVEADESDGSFLLYDTAVALITNVDPDHLDHYGDEEAFERAFVRFADRASEVAVVSADDPGAVRVADRLTGVRLVRFGRAAEADVRLVDVVASGPVRFALETADGRFDIALRVAGEHNAVNAAGAFAVLTALGVEPAAAVAGLERFGGTERRFELHGEAGDVRVYDDYAHHPTEVDAALTAARTVVGGGRIIAVHQPHLYSRTAAFAGEFAEVLERTADHTIVLDVFGAREDPVEGVTGALVADRFADPAHVDFIADWSAAAARAAEIARPGDFVVTLGCGDVYRIVPQLLGALRGTGASAA